MSKTTAALAALGVVAGLGVATLPLSSYAANDPISHDVNLSAKVEETLSFTLSSTDGKVNIDDTEGATKGNATINFGTLVADGEPASAILTARIRTNKSNGYTLKLANKTDVDGKAVLQGTTDKNATIATGKPAEGTSAWGYKVSQATIATGATNTGTSVSASTEWVNIPLSTNATELINSDKPTKEGTEAEGYADAGDTVDITFGVSASAAQAADTYTGAVVLTAAVNS